MRPILISTSDLDGGAAWAAYRLHQGLRTLGVDSRMLVQSKLSQDESVFSLQTKIAKGLNSIKPTLDMLPLYLYNKADKPISCAWVPNKISRLIRQHAGNLTHLHWVSKGYVAIETLKKLPSPIIWTLHDMWSFTGGCHYDLGCGRYIYQCGNCPILESLHEKDLSRWIWSRKHRAWRDLNITLVCPSHWLADCAARSSLFTGKRIEVIPNGLDVQRFKPVDRRAAREWLGLPQDRRLILFSAARGVGQAYKGFSYLIQALPLLMNLGWQDRIGLVILGGSPDRDIAHSQLPVYPLGHLHDEISLGLVYGAVDVFVAPSIQDNFPNTVMESMACGTPCVASRVGGIPEMLSHQEDGYLFTAGDPHELAVGIAWVLGDTEHWHHLAENARQRALRDFNHITQAQRYLDLYEELLNATVKANNPSHG